MPLLEETSLPQRHSLTVPVVIIGNGPSGICLSYLLSGYRPYVAPGIVHPNPILQSKLEEGSHCSVVHQDLEYLGEGLEGRSSNPVAVLFDTLLHPDADFQFDYPSVLQWKLEKHENIPHIVLGKGLPGGAWHVMKGSMLTISLGNWMELPGLKFKDWASSKRRNPTNDRATTEDIASYYKDYVKIMGLQKNFADNTCVTSVSKSQQDQENTKENDEMDISTRQLPATNVADQNGLPQNLWEVSGYQKIGEGSPVPFCLLAENVVLATGTYDSPARLGVEGEDLPFVFHSISDFEVAIKNRKVNQASDPVLIVGAGLTAADAILCAYHNNIPVIHTFRRSVNDPGLIFKQLPKALYPEYHKVYHKMCKQSYSTASGLYTNYTSFPENCIVSFQPDMKCILQSASGVKTVLSISLALILIGSYPNLSFLKDHGKYLGVDPSKSISCKRNPVDINPCTFECTKEATLFCMGPLIGDNFVRFLKGGALGIASCLMKRLKKKGQLISEVGGADGYRTGVIHCELKMILFATKNHQQQTGNLTRGSDLKNTSQ
ncbi:oxidative stress-induced growth inhibitor 2 [Callorhinchus milii]|uniref:oxidative stress-induced growth inhibitor 2 n=1 Tax=Callorhinchus milii TaxID=7868 RepID=UPI0004572BDD|nr:oxidative stress-induced growth inhibitor 2 [Callorhinchus milii]|eukprot:gi/632970063/ref/XP_007901432.1/ PREDICTED: oxidative stress-induced growth inhibitor 2 [Callorhinchus milii]